MGGTNDIAKTKNTKVQKMEESEGLNLLYTLNP